MKEIDQYLWIFEVRTDSQEPRESDLKIKMKP